MHLDHRQIFTFFFETVVPVRSPERRRTHPDLPAAECQVLGLQACATVPTIMQISYFSTLQIVNLFPRPQSTLHYNKFTCDIIRTFIRNKNSSLQYKRLSLS